MKVRSHVLVFVHVTAYVTAYATAYVTHLRQYLSLEYLLLYSARCEQSVDINSPLLAISPHSRHRLDRGWVGHLLNKFSTTLGSKKVSERFAFIFE